MVRIGWLSILLLSPLFAVAVCPDRDAIMAAEAHAQSYFRGATIFHQGRVLKVHNPSKNKEVVAYVDSGDGRKYSIFTVVNHECQVRFIKRTRQND